MIVIHVRTLTLQRIHRTVVYRDFVTNSRIVKKSRGLRARLRIKPEKTYPCDITLKTSVSSIQTDVLYRRISNHSTAAVKQRQYYLTNTVVVCMKIRILLRLFKSCFALTVGTSTCLTDVLSKRESMEKSCIFCWNRGFHA